MDYETMKKIFRKMQDLEKKMLRYFAPAGKFGE
jgi:hypothetical protein